MFLPESQATQYCSTKIVFIVCFFYMGFMAARLLCCEGEFIRGTPSFSPPAANRGRFFIPSKSGGVLRRADDGERGDPKLSAPPAREGRAGVATTRGCSATDRSMRRCTWLRTGVEMELRNRSKNELLDGGPCDESRAASAPGTGRGIAAGPVETGFCLAGVPAAAHLASKSCPSRNCATATRT